MNQNDCSLCILISTHLYNWPNIILLEEELFGGEFSGGNPPSENFPRGNRLQSNVSCYKVSAFLKKMPINNKMFRENLRKPKIFVNMDTKDVKNRSTLENRDLEKNKSNSPNIPFWNTLTQL